MPDATHRTLLIGHCEGRGGALSPVAEPVLLLVVGGLDGRDRAISAISGAFLPLDARYSGGNCPW